MARAVELAFDSFEYLRTGSLWNSGPEHVLPYGLRQRSWIRGRLPLCRKQYWRHREYNSGTQVCARVRTARRSGELFDSQRSHYFHQNGREQTARQWNTRESAERYGFPCPEQEMEQRHYRDLQLRIHVRSRPAR